MPKIPIVILLLRVRVGFYRGKPAIMTKKLSIGQYLLKQLYLHGVKHIFGVPGDYILGFYDRMVKSPVQHIGTTREDTAAFAADGYARSRGLGALAVTYGVGALSVVNAVAVSADGQYLVTASGDNTIEIWDLSSETIARTLVGHDDAVYDGEAQTFAAL